MTSMRGLTWGGLKMTIVFVTTVATAAAAGSGARKLRADPLSALEKHDLIDLLDIELDDMFLVPKVMLQDHDAQDLEPQKNRKRDGNKNNNAGNIDSSSDNKGHRQRNLQSSPSPSPSLPTFAPTGDALSSGTSFYDFSSSTSSPSATPSTAAPTVGPSGGGGGGGGLYSSASPTAAPSAMDVVDDDGTDGPREVAAAATWGGGEKSVWIATVTALLAVAMGIFS